MMKPKTADKIATVVLYSISIFVVVVLASFVLYIFYKGLRMITPSFIFGSPKVTEAGGGIGPEIFNSLYMLVISLIITVPIGVGAGIYLAEYAKEGIVIKIIRLSLEAMASLPSIVIGMFGLLVFVNMAGFGYSILAGALSVSILNIPIITRISESAIRNASVRVKEASLALGVSKWQTIMSVIVPTASKEIITGVILAAGRIFGEAAALLYTAGLSSAGVNFNHFSFVNQTSAFSLLRPAETLAVHIWYLNAEGIVPDAAQIINGTAAVLVIIVLLFNFAARLISKRLERSMEG